MNEYLTMREASEYLGVSKGKMWRLVKEGTLSSFKDNRDKRKRLIKREDVERLKQPEAI